MFLANLKVLWVSSVRVDFHVRSLFLMFVRASSTSVFHHRLDIAHGFMAGTVSAAVARIMSLRQVAAFSRLASWCGVCIMVFQCVVFPTAASWRRSWNETQSAFFQLNRAVAETSAQKTSLDTISNRM